MQIQDLVRVQSVAWAEDIGAGGVVADASKVISVRQGGWHGKLPLTATAGDGSLVTTTESGEDITIQAGATTGNDDTFTDSFTDANAETSPTRTITVDVTEAPTSAEFTVPAVPTEPGGTQHYVATTGNDTTGDGTIGSPYTA